MIRPVKLTLVLMIIQLLPVQVQAHHAFNHFDTQTIIQMRGTIVAFEWTSPHTRTRVDVSNLDGSVSRWELEGMSPAYLRRHGWTPGTLRPGGKVTVFINPLRSGEPGGTLRRAIREDGTTVYMYGNPENAGQASQFQVDTTVELPDNSHPSKSSTRSSAG